MLHLKKLCVGIKSFEMLQEWQDNELKCNRQLFHTTRMKPKKINEMGNPPKKEEKGGHLKSPKTDESRTEFGPIEK